jgi:hypothetical protein
LSLGRRRCRREKFVLGRVLFLRRSPDQTSTAFIDNRVRKKQFVFKVVKIGVIQVKPSS